MKARVIKVPKASSMLYEFANNPLIPVSLKSVTTLKNVAKTKNIYVERVGLTRPLFIPFK